MPKPPTQLQVGAITLDVGDDFVECGTSDADYAYFGLETGRRAAERVKGYFCLNRSVEVSKTFMSCAPPCLCA